MFKKILVACDFSQLSEAAMQLALWLARKSHGSITLTNILSDFRAAMEAMPIESRKELVAGDIEKFHKELCAGADSKLQDYIKTLSVTDMNIAFQHQVLLGSPDIEISQVVQKEKHDIVLCGTKDVSKIKRFLVGSTAKNLVRYCPSAVWVLRDPSQVAIKSLVVAVDLSEVSAKALKVGAWIAEQSGAELHILHVVDSKDFPAGMFKQMRTVSGVSCDWKEEVEKSGRKRLNDFLSQNCIKTGTQRLVWGEPYEEINSEVLRTGSQLVVMGTVGRTGMAGLLLGNTAEKVLDSCKASILSVKPDAFKSAIEL